MDYKRNMRIVLGNALIKHPAVTVVGARGVGKTKLVSEFATHKGYAYCDMQEVRHIIAAQDDPVGFVARLPKPIVLDGVHRVPEMLPALQDDIARDPVPGKYLCTSSSDPSYDKRLQMLNQTHVLSLYSHSQGELQHTTEHFIDAIFNMPNLIQDDVRIAPFDAEKFLCGGFAQTLAMSDRERDVWFNRYLLNYVHHDISLQMQVEDHMLFVRLLRVLAQYAAHPLNSAEISRQSGIPITTLNRYLAVLKNVHLYFEQSAWDGKGLIKRATKAPQSYMHDVGFVSWLLGPELRAQADYEEGLLRHAVYNELQKQMTWNDSSVELLHMRTMNGHDVDMILQRTDGKAIGIWVKNAAYVTPQDTKGLLHCKERLGDRWHRGIILHTGTELLPLGNKLWMMPISALWSYNTTGTG